MLLADIYTYLASKSDLTSALGSDSVYDFWLFRERLQATVEQSSSAAVVIDIVGGWTAPNTHNTMSFPRLLVLIYADSSRDVARNITEDDSRDLADEVFALIDKYLHLPGQAGFEWGDTRILRSTRLSEPVATPVQDGAGMTLVTAYYGLGIG